MKYPALTDGASWFIDKILFRSKYMNTFTRSSIELISPSVYSGHFVGYKGFAFINIRLHIHPTTRCFLFFGFGFHTRVESLYYYPKASLKYIRAIFRNLFYRDSVRQSLTTYKLSKNNVKHMLIISDFANMSNKINRLIAYVSPPLRTGTYIGNGVKMIFI